jgi:hypothetical protein
MIGFLIEYWDIWEQATRYTDNQMDGRTYERMDQVCLAWQH